MKVIAWDLFLVMNINPKEEFRVAASPCPIGVHGYFSAEGATESGARLTVQELMLPERRHGNRFRYSVTVVGDGIVLNSELVRPNGVVEGCVE